MEIKRVNIMVYFLSSNIKKWNRESLKQLKVCIFKLPDMYFKAIQNLQF
jgi:hypothetical protein